MSIWSNIARATSLFSEGIVSSAEEFSKASKEVPKSLEASDEEPENLVFDPFSIIEQLGFKDKPSAITYGTLQAIVWRTPIIQSIILTRLNQIATFARPQQDKFETGYRVRLADKTAKMSPADNKRSKQIEQMFYNCGVIRDNVLERCTFDNFLRAISRDSLVFDQINFEITKNKKGEPAAFYAVDAATIRLADTSSISYTYDPDKIYTVQIYDNMVINQWTKDRMAFCVRNPHTNIRLAGYGVSEIEMLINAITAILWAFEYNQKFFCISGDSLISTEKGQIPIKDLEGKNFISWTGKEWAESRAFKSRARPLVRTWLKNGLSIDTSPEHKFLVSKGMQTKWVEQSNLKIGDIVLLDSQPKDCSMDETKLLVNKKYLSDRRTSNDFIPSKEMINDLEFWEMMGFALGDGYFPSGSEKFGIYPHHTKDLALFDKFKNVCTRYNINHQLVQINKHHKRVSDGEYGYPAIHIHQKTFIDWLRDIGFKPSTDGKRIPFILFQMPFNFRGAFLRGLFSADGHTRNHIEKYSTPSVCAVNPILRQDILRLLLSIGVGSTWERKRKGGWGDNIRVQDIQSFVEKIGYLQDYKNKNLLRNEKSKYRWDCLSKQCSLDFSLAIQGHPGSALAFPIGERDYNLLKAAEYGTTRISRHRAIQLMKKAGCEIKPLFHYHQMEVIEIEQTTEIIQMYDVEVFNDEHLFLANGIAVHNSEGSVAKGVLNIKGTMNQRQLRAFRRHWYQMISGVENSWKSPVLNSPEGAEWIKMNETNVDMGFASWMDFLIKLIAGVYQMDPMEIGFKYGNSGQDDKAMFESGNKEKLTASKDKGLRPILHFIESEFTRYIVNPIEEDFVFEFVGLERETKKELADLNAVRVASSHTLNEIRQEQDLPLLDDGDIVLNTIYIQHLSNLEAQKAAEQQATQATADNTNPTDPTSTFSEEDFNNLKNNDIKDITKKSSESEVKVLEMII